MYVYVYIYIYTYLSICLYIYSDVHAHTYVYVRVYIHMITYRAYTNTPLQVEEENLLSQQLFSAGHLLAAPFATASACVNLCTCACL